MRKKLGRKKGKLHEAPTIDRDFFNKAEVESRFRDKRMKYELFVDEFAPAVYLPKLNKSVLWSDIPTRHRKFLGIILKALPKQYPITFQTIFDKTISTDHAVTFSPAEYGPRIRSNLTELNKLFSKLFKSLIKAERGMDQYAFIGQITYCWIRPDNHSTRLLPSSP